MLERWELDVFAKFARIAKLVPLLVTIVIIAQISLFFKELAGRNCSDQITNLTLTELAQVLPQIEFFNLAVLVCDLLQTFLVPFLGYHLDSEDKKIDNDSASASESAAKASASRELNGGTWWERSFPGFEPGQKSWVKESQDEDKPLIVEIDVS